MSAPQVTIIGAGPGGLAAAILLANAGARVTVLERLGRVGGRCSALESDGFRFDLGPTFFLYPRVLQEIFGEVRRDLFEEVPMTRLDPQYRIAFGAGGKIDATSNLDRMEQEIAALCPADASHFRRFMTDNRRKLEAFRPILESPFGSVLDLFRRSTLKAALLLRPWLSVNGELQRYFSDPRLAIAFSFQSKYLGMSPYQCPSLFSILAFLEYEHGVFHPRGGCSAVSERMAQVATDLGVDIRLDEAVEELRFDGRRIKAVRSSVQDYKTDALIINADFARAMQRLVPESLRPKWKNRDLAAKKFSCSTFMMYLGIEGQYETPHHTIYIATDYDRNLREIERDHILSDDPSFYVQNAGVTDSTLAPKGMSTLYVLVPVTHMHANVDWDHERRRFRELALDQLEKIGISGIRERIRFEKIVTPADWDRGYEIHLGATFNLAHDLGQMLHRRPQNRFRSLDGVYLVGGGTHPGSGLPVIYESARITSKLIQRDFGLTHDSAARALPRLPSAFAGEECLVK